MNDLITEVIKTALRLLEPVIAGALVALILKLLQRLNLSIDENEKAKVNALTQDVILQVEEWAAARIKAKIPEPTTAKDKLEKALADLTAKVPGITQDEAADLIHANLAKVGAGATSFLQGLQSASATGAQ